MSNPWNFNWGVFWAVLAAFAIMRALAVAFPLSVTMTMADFRAIIDRLDSIDSKIEDET